MSNYPWQYKYRDQYGRNSLQDESTLWFINSPLEIAGIFVSTNFVSEGYTIDAAIFNDEGNLVVSVKDRTFCIDIINGSQSGLSYTDYLWSVNYGAQFISQIDGNYYLAWSTASAGYITKVNSVGATIWNRSSTFYEPLTSVILDSADNLSSIDHNGTFINFYITTRTSSLGHIIETTFFDTYCQDISNVVVNNDRTAFYFIYSKSNVTQSFIIKVIPNGTLPPFVTKIEIRADIGSGIQSVRTVSKGPIFVSDSELYFTSQYGLFKASFSESTCDLIYGASDFSKNASHPSIYFDESNNPQYIIYRADNILYKLQKSGLTWVEDWKNDIILPTGTIQTVAPIWTSSDQIFIASGNQSTGSNVHLFNGSGSLRYSSNFGSDIYKYVKDAAMIGGRLASGRPAIALNIAEVDGVSSGLMYILAESSEPTTTTTTTTTPATTTTTTTTPTTTTTTTTGTTTPTTTTTTTTPTTTTTTTTTQPPRRVLKKVETVVYLADGTSITAQDGSNNKGTINSIFSESLSLGMLSPGSLSETKLISLRLPSSAGINNIKLGLIDTGGLDFTKAKFYIDTLTYIDYNFVPYNYFQGVNINKLSSSEYNISIPNGGLLESQYVYLKVYVPDDQAFAAGTVRYSWFFDYSSGV